MTADPGAAPEPGRALASIVIPAFDEGRVIDACLRAIADSRVGPLEIVVAANGCTDDTVAVARRHAGVVVLDLPTPGKVGALNAGDDAASAFPRIFLDADIVLGPGALAGLIEALSTAEAIVAAPSVRFDTRGCDRGVRLFYDAYRELPYVRSGMVGLGVYGLSRAGRARFGRFPDVQADDLFVQRLFAPDERRTTPGYFEVRAPRELSSLLKVRTRVARGNAELAEPPSSGTRPGGDGDFSASTGSTVRSLLTAVRARPRLAPAALTYVAVIAAARARARHQAGRPATWHRDESTR